MATLILIYSIGFGNTAVLTEKFTSMSSCKLAEKLINIDLQKAVKSSICITD